jgi:phenylpropionate dioxygenase-like ring-hydroxylating dioxygenase large terminal subunit
MLVDRASRPLSEMQACPAEYYTNEDLYALEVERIFQRDWLYVCRADEVPQPGSWYSAEIAGEPIVVVRGSDGEVRAFSRVCPHRFMDVLGEEDGRTGSAVDGFTCPYHSWAYALDGKLTGAPFMSRSDLFERERGSLCLLPFQAEVWQGFVFVNLDATAPPLAPRLAQLDELLAPYRLAEWRVIDHVDWPESPVSWKLAMDNGRECYHHQGAHRVSVEPLWPANLVEVDTNDSGFFFWERLFCAPDAATGVEDGHHIQPVFLPPLDGLTPYLRSFSYLVGIYPTMWFAPSSDVMLVAKWWPTGPHSHKFWMDVCVHESQLANPDLQKAVDEVREWGRQIQTEDSRMVTATQRMVGSKAAQALPGGPLSHMERPLWQFQKYMANRLADANIS